MNLTKKPYRRSYSLVHRRVWKKKTVRALLFGTIGSLLLLAGACSFTTEMAEDSVNPKLSVMGLQSDVTEVNVRVTGQDYQQSVTVTPSDSRIELFLPPGDDVKFEVEADNQDSATSHVNSWGMTRYADLTKNQETELAFTMGPKDTKIFIPDYYSFSGTVVELSSLNINKDTTSLDTDNWLAKDTSGGNPFDIALDNQGRIWISYIYYSTSNLSNSYNLLMRENLSSLGPSYETGVIAAALAFDSLNNYLYFFNYDTNLSQYQLARIFVDSDSNNISAPEFFDVTLEGDISYFDSFGLAVDNDGYLYFVGSDGGDFSSIYKYDPSRISGNRVVSKVTSQKLGYSHIDLLVKNNHLYVTNHSGASGELILKYNKNLEFVDSFGVPSDGTVDEVGEFMRPARFLTTTSDSIFVTDDDYGNQNTNRIIKFNDTDGSGWESYNPTAVPYSQTSDALRLFFSGS